MPTSGRIRMLVVGIAFLAMGAALAWTLEKEQINKADSDGALANSSVRLSEGAFVPSAGERPAEVWAVGDGADAGLAGADVTRLIESSRPDRVLYLGDVYESGTAEEFAENYAPTFGRLAEITAPSLGNHEAPNIEQGYEPYWMQVLGATPPSFYSFELAGWEILSLNSEIDYSPGSEQVRWIDEATSGGSDCRIAFWHRPRYSAGTVHGDDPSLQSLWDALSGRARLVVNAHEHNMQRLEPRQGMVQLIAGAGGRGSYPIDPGYQGLKFGDDQRQGGLRLRVRPGRASYAFVSTNGKILDSGSLRCQVG